MQRCRQALNPALPAAHAQLHFIGCSLVQTTAAPAVQGCLTIVQQQLNTLHPLLPSVAGGGRGLLDRRPAAVQGLP